MSTDNRAQNDTELEDLLARRSPLSRDYANMARAEPAPDMDARILAAARSAAAAPAVTPGAGQVANVAPAKTPTAPRNIPRPLAARTPVAVVDQDDDEDDEPTPATRPRWMVPAALAASLVLAVGIGFTLFSDNGTETGVTAPTGSTIAKRSRKSVDAVTADDAATSEAASDRDAEVVVLNADRPSERPVLPPPPFFAPEMPQVEDLDAAIAMIRKELVVASQKAAMRAEGPAPSALSAAPAGGQADLQSDVRSEAQSGAPVSSQPESSTSAVVIQPRDRRLVKILELYDNGNPELAADSLEIFLRDFADDPITQQILARKP